MVGLIHGIGDVECTKVSTGTKLTIKRRCRHNNLVIKVEKMKELIVDFCKSRPEYTPLNISDSPVDSVDTINFLGVQISDNTIWSQNTTGVL